MTGKNTINRIKVVLAEKGKTNLLLAEQIGKNEATFPDGVPTKHSSFGNARNSLRLEVDVKELLNQTRGDVQFIKIQQS